MDKTKSIKNTIAISFLIGLIIPLTIAGILFVKISADSLEDEIVLRNRQLSIKLTEQIDEYLNRPIHSLKVLSGLINDASVKENQIKTFFDVLLNSQNDFLKIQMADNNGIVRYIAPFDANYTDIDVSNRDLYKKPKESGRVYWSPTFFSLQLNRPAVSVSIPVKKGVITGFISLDGLKDIVNSSLVGKHSFITITDQAGIFIEHPDHDKITQREYDPNFKRLYSGSPDRITIKKIQVDKKDMLCFAGLVEKTKWGVVVYQSVADLFQPVRKLYFVSLCSVLFIFAIVIYLSSTHVGKIINEIKRFADSAQVISDGHYNEKIKNIKYDEFKSLADQFNIMAASVEERESAIRENEKKLKQILDSVGVGIFMVEPVDMSITYANPEAGKILQQSVENIIGKKYFDIVKKTARNTCLQPDPGNKMDVQEEELLNGEGEYTHVLKTATMTKFEGKQRIVESFIDLTHIKVIEQEKIKLEQQIRQVQKMEAIGTLAGGIAHDFNNILFPIIGFAEMALEDLEPGSIPHSNVSEVLTAAKRAKEMVKQIVTFSRQSKGELKLTRVEKIIEEVLNLLKSTLPVNIKTTLNIQPAGQVLVDPTQIHQVIMNLITNAYHSMENTGGTITITLKEITVDKKNVVDTIVDSGRYVSLTISDTGTGMDRNTLERVFDPYFTTKKTGKGTGLGLSVVHGIIKGYNGDIKVYSEKGSGSSFTIYLPVSGPETDDTHKGKDIAIQGGTESILVVDDERQVLNLLELTIQSLGYTTTSHISSLNALDEFKTRPDDFDLVITDMTMPSMTGLQLTDELLKIRPGLPIIICTGFSQQLTEKKIEDIGIKGVVMKPIIKAEIAEAIRSALEED